MRLSRRTLLATGGALAAAGLGGCMDGELTGEGAAFGATQAAVSASVQSETGYAEHRVVEDTVTESFSLFGLTRTVEVTNVISEYDRAIELPVLGVRIQAAVFATLATPQVRIIGRSFNPVADMSTEEIARLLQERYDEISDVQQDQEFSASVGGETTSVTRFTGRARLIEIGQGIDIYLYISEAVEIDDDYVVTLAVHPQAWGTKQDTVRTLMAGVEH